MAVEVGAAFISVRPDLRGFHNTIKRELRSMAPSMVSIGREWGAQLQRGIKEKLNPIEVRLDAGQVAQRLATLNRALDRIDGRRVTARVDVVTVTAAGLLAGLKDELDRIDGRRVNVQIHVDMGGAVAEVMALEQLLTRLDGQRINIQIDADVAAALAQLAAVRGAVTTIDNRRSINIDVDIGSAMAGIGSLRMALIGLAVVASPALVGIGAGIVGLIGPLAAAGAGAAAFGAVAIPAISNVAKALQQQKQATQQSGAASGQATQQAFAEASARQQLASAIRNAAHAHQQALDQVRQAQQQYQQSVLAEVEAQRELTVARAQARRSLEDLKNQVISAGLAVQEAQLGVEQSRASWQQMAAAAKAAASQVAAAQSALARAEEAQRAVLADPAATDAAKQQAKAGVDAARQALKSAQDQKKAADLAARQAELNFRQSVQRLREQQLQLRRLQQDEKSAAKAGVEGSDAVRQARQRLAKANQQTANSELALRRARENVARTDQQSADQIAAARRALAQATSQAAVSSGGLGQQLIKLTALEQDLADAWKSLTAAFSDWSRSLQPAVIPALIKGIGFLKALLPTLTPLVRGAAAGIGELFDRASAAAKSPFWTQFSQFLGQAAGPAIVGIGTLLGNLLKSLAGLAQSFAPIGFAFLQVLNAVAARFAAFTTGLASNPAFQEFTRQFVALGPLMTQTFVSLGRLVGSLFAALAPALGPILGFVNTLAASLTSVLRQAGPAIASVFSALGSGLSAVLVALAPVVTQLVQALAPLLVQLINGLKPILIALVPVLGQIIAGLAPVIGALLSGLQPAIESLVPVVSLLVGALAKILGAVAPVLPILGQFIASLVTGLMPVLTPIVQAIALVAQQIAGALIQALRQSAPALQQMVLAIASLLPELLPLVPLWAEWFRVLLPLLPVILQLATVLLTALLPVLRVAIQVVVWYWTTIANLLLPVFRLMVSVITWVASILTPIFQAIGWAIRGLGAVAMWLWNSAIKPAFSFIASLARWLYSIIAVVVIAPLLIAFKVLGAVVRWLWSNVIKPAFTLIGALIRGVYNTFIKPVLDAFRRVIREYLAPAVQWLWNSVIRPVWGWIGGHVRSVYNSFIKPTIDKFKSVIGTLSGAFKTAVDAIGRQWDRLKDVAKKPVAFVVNTVFNSGIVKIWNAVAKLVPGVKTLNPIQGFAAGGVVQSGAYGVLPGYAPGRDTMLAAVSPGEAWIRPDATRALGSSFIYGLNAAAASGGTAAAARFLAERGAPRFGLGGIVGGFLKSAKDMFTGGLVKTATKAFNPLLDIADRAVGGTPFGDLAVGTARGMVAQILSYFKPLESKIGGDGRKVVKVAEKYLGLSGNPNKFTQRMGMNGLPWCGMFVDGVFDEANAGKALKGVGNPAAVWSYRALPSVPQGAKRAGDLGLYRGDAGHINIFTGKGTITIGGNESNSVRRQSGYINSASSIRRPRFGLGGIVPTILAQDREENRRATTPLATQLLRGIAGQPLLFDNGGWLPPGLTTVLNNTGRPEAVLPPGALRAIVDGRSGGAARSVSVMDNATVIVQDPVDLDLLTQRQEFAARAATFGE